MKTSYCGPPIDDLRTLDKLPDDLAKALKTENGFIAVEGGFHVRGASLNPEWHSLRAAWEGEFALYQLYPTVRNNDIPWAEDCFGDQYLIRDGLVVRLSGETGEIEETHSTWSDFLSLSEEDPIEFLNLSHLERFRNEGGVLLPGQLLSVYPPFVTTEGGHPSLKPIPALERRAALADLARQISNIPDGQRIKIVVH
jgi:hypothetical protein